MSKIDYCGECDNTGFTDELCRNCSGSGEGMYDGSTCSACRGSGNSKEECTECKGDSV